MICLNNFRGILSEVWLYDVVITSGFVTQKGYKNLFEFWFQTLRCIN